MYLISLIELKTCGSDKLFKVDVIFRIFILLIRFATWITTSLWFCLFCTVNATIIVTTSIHLILIPGATRRPPTFSLGRLPSSVLSGRLLRTLRVTVGSRAPLLVRYRSHPRRIILDYLRTQCNIMSQAADKATLTAPVKQQPQQHCLRRRGRRNTSSGGMPPFTCYSVTWLHPPGKKVSNCPFTWMQ